MDEVPGSMGTSASFALRLGQTIFSSASLLFMSLGVQFYNFTSFCFLVTTMGLVIPWSFTLALVDAYSVLVKCPIRHSGILLIIVVGDWVLSILTLAAACSTASVLDLLLRADGSYCPSKFCSRSSEFFRVAYQTMRYNEISSFSHPQHKLKFEYTEVPFKCDGCKEIGIGSRYKCNTCDYDLHMHCANPSLSISHPFYTKCSFQFLSRPPGNTPRYCNACEKDVTGFVYHCKSCGFDLHPCCAKLPMVLDDGEVKLYLYRKVSAPCDRCGRKGRSWSYRSSCKKYNLHVACVKEMLVETWHEIFVGRGYGNSARKLETRIPSLKGTLQTHHRKRKGKAKKCCEMAGLALQFVISAVLGDPTTLIAGVVGSFISK